MMTRLKHRGSAFATLLLVTSCAAAQSATSPSDREVTNRLAYLQNALDEGRAAANLWWYGWLVGYSGATAGQVAVYSGSDDEKQRQDMLVGAATTGLGAIYQLLTPMDAARLPTRLRAMPEDNPEARRAKLAAAESFLHLCAAGEKRGRSWKTHALAGAVNLGAGLVIWKHYKRPAEDGLITFAVGQLISEVQIFTQPTKAVRDLREYEARSDFGQGGGDGSASRSWYLGVTPEGFLVGCRF
jgi:hypothetical protein